MRIALYVPAWPSGSRPNGIVTYGSHLVPALRALGHEVFIVTPEARSGSQEKDPYTIDLNQYEVPRSLWQSAVSRFSPNSALFKAASTQIASAIKDLVNRHQIEVFEIEESFGFSYAVSCLRIVPVVVRLHGPWFLNGRFDSSFVYSNNDLRREKRERRGIVAAEVVTSPSRITIEAVKSHYGIDLPMSFAIPNPITAVPQPKRWNIDTCEKDSLLFVGRFDKRKGGELVILAFSELATKNKNLRLTFVGPDLGVHDADGKLEFFNDYTSRVLSPDARSRVTFTHTQPHTAIAGLRGKHFATLCTSQSEIFPYSVLEPMSFGCPVVATSVGGIPEMIHSGRNGLLVPAQDIRAIVLAIQDLLDNPSAAAAYGEQAWEDCQNKFNSEQVALSTSNAYQRAIDRFNKF